MQVNRVQSTDNNLNFKAKVVDSSSYRKFQNVLNPKDKKAFNSYIKTIEAAKDKNNYIFEYITLGMPNKTRTIATISKQNKDKTIQHPPVFSEKAEKALNLFKNLAESVK